MAKHGGIKDSGEYFVITPASRKVTVPHAHKSIATVGDHNSEQITFVCPQILDGHDISQCASRYITWQNVNGEIGHDELNIVQVENSAEGMLYLAWTIRNGLTVAKGVVQFSVHFEDFDDDGTTLYRWSTATCKDCDILDSVNAVLGAYEAVYVAGDTLVFANYNAVKGEVLEIKTDGIIPEGTLEIQENGTYIVGEYAKVKVNVIEDADLIPDNIKKGVNISGVEGAYDPLPLISGSIRIDNQIDNHPFDLMVYYSGCSQDASDIVLANSFKITDGGSFKTKVVKDSLIIIKALQSGSATSQGGLTLHLPYGVEMLSESSTYSMFVIKPTRDNFSVIVTDYSIG